MAEWLPEFISVGGAYVGKIPQDSLDSFISNAGGGYVQDDVINISAQFRDNVENHNWAGHGLVDLWNMVDDGQPHELLLFEMPVKNPEGATYYRQTLAFIATYEKRVITDGSVGAGYRQTIIQFGFTKIYRREYATPYSTPVSTLLAQGSNSIRIDHVDVDGLFPPGYQYMYLDGDLYYGLSYGSYDGETYFCIYGYKDTERADFAESNYTEAIYALTGINVDTLNSEFGEFIPEETDDPNEDPDDPTDPTDPGGGGKHDRTEDPVDFPPLPSIGAASAGFITIYRMNLYEMTQFAHELFLNPLDPGGAWQAIKSFFADPMDFICGCMIVPFIPESSYKMKPKFGNFTWSTAYDVIENEFQIIDCGAMIVPYFYKNAFDMNPYTKVKIFLPYIGYRELDADEVMGQSIRVKYYVDCVTGDCVAMIGKETPAFTQVIAQFSGNCAVRVPFGRVSYDAAVAASIQLLGGAINAGITAAGGGGNINVGGMATTAVNGLKVNTERSGVAGASAGYMSLQIPHLIREIPDQDLPTNYRRINGYPSNKGGTLSQFRGYTVIENIELSGIAATADEKQEIMSLLKGGCII